MYLLPLDANFRDLGRASALASDHAHTLFQLVSEVALYGTVLPSELTREQSCLSSGRRAVSSFGVGFCTIRLTGRLDVDGTATS